MKKVSIVTCSVRPDQYKELVASFKSNTSDVDWEFIEMIKVDKPLTIAQGYNQGIAQAQGDIICFIHEDSRCRQHDWLKQVTEFYEEHNKCAILGLVGTIRLSFMGAHWMSGMKYGRGKLIQFDQQQDYSSLVPEVGKQPHYEVISVDGFCFFARKEALQKANKGKGFDEEYEGFHFYDTDISLACREVGYKNFVLANCLFQHLSAGQMDADWRKSQRVYWRKWGRNDRFLN